MIYNKSVEKNITQSKNKNSQIFYYPNDSIKYFGETLNGLFHGKGIHYLTANQIYVKNWENDDYSDNVGAFILEIYEGEFKNGKADGLGSNKYFSYEREVIDDKIANKYNSTLVHEYKGVWKDGELIKGSYFYHGKLINEGFRKNLTLNGNGILYFDNGKKSFEGQFVEGIPFGNGTLFYENGNYAYIGLWKNGKENGQGISYYENGNIKYQGEWQNGMKNGQGVSFYRNGKKEFQGKWKDNKKHGEGILFEDYGEIKIHGKWKYNEYIGKDKFYLDSITWYSNLAKKNKFYIIWFIGIIIYFLLKLIID